MYILVFIFWLILVGSFTLETVLFGIGITAAIGVFVYFIFDYPLSKDIRLTKKFPLLLAYIGMLMWEIVKANVAVMIFIINSHRKTEPTLVTFRPDIHTKAGRFLLANSITLTPGTITVEVKDEEFTVHCLSRPLLDISDEGIFVRMIRRLEA